MVKVLTLVFVLTASIVRAQALPVDKLTPALPTVTEQRVADIASWVTAGTLVGYDAVRSWQQGSRSRWMLLARTSVTAGAVLGLKSLVQRDRPCSPVCGADNPHFSMPSGHTAFAFSASVNVPLAATTGGLRIAANKHWLTDTLTGAAIGWATSHIR